MAVTHELEHNETQLTIRVVEALDLKAMEKAYDLIKQHIPLGIRSILLFPAEAPLSVAVVDAVKFGRRIGDLLAGTGIVVAVVEAPRQKYKSYADSQVFIKGVKIAEFDDEKRARDWLKTALASN